MKNLQAIALTGVFVFANGFAVDAAAQAPREAAGKAQVSVEDLQASIRHDPTNPNASYRETIQRTVEHFTGRRISRDD